VGTCSANAKWIWRIVTDVAARGVNADRIRDSRAIVSVESTFIVIDAASEWTTSVEAGVTNADEGFSVVGVIRRACSVQETGSGSSRSWSANSIRISVSTASSRAIRVDTIGGKWITSVWADEGSSCALINISTSEVRVLFVSSATVASELGLVDWINRTRGWSNTRVGSSAKTEWISTG